MEHMPLNQITLTTIQQFYDHMAHAAQHGYQKNYNEATIKRIRGLLSRIFSVAQEMGIIPDSPIKNRLLQIKAEQSGHHKVLPDALIAKVKQKIPTLEDPEFRLYFALLAYTGMKREEILGLHWEDVELDTGTAYVRWTVTYPNQNHPVVPNSVKSKRSIRPVLRPGRFFIVPRLQKTFLPAWRTGYGKWAGGIPARRRSRCWGR